MGRPSPSQMACSLEFSPLIVHPIERVTSFFLEGAGARGEDAVEQPHPAPADEAVVQRLVRSEALRRIFHLLAMPDDKDDLGNHTPVIDLRNPMRQGKARRFYRRYHQSHLNPD